MTFPESNSILDFIITFIKCQLNQRVQSKWITLLHYTISNLYSNVQCLDIINSALPYIPIHEYDMYILKCLEEYLLYYIECGVDDNYISNFIQNTMLPYCQLGKGLQNDSATLAILSTICRASVHFVQNYL